MSGSGERFRKMDELFRAALRLSAEERTRFLSEQCAEDPTLRREIEELLDEDDRTHGVLDTPVLGDEMRLSRITEGLGGEPEPIPDRIGPYRVISKLGEGGMGSVYEAEQDNPRRKVALKVITRGMRSQTVLRRFEGEANLLARLQHPGIAQVYEAGVQQDERGARPYFAMELIRGVPLTVYAREHDLSVRERLALLAHVCDAVQHAHQRGVIHRDLKPANILVDESGAPKILDFGVARATDADIQMTTSRTDVGQIVGTISYMSPEQAGGDPNELDTRSDIYSLGVIAYELLVDRMPYDLKGRMLHEAVRVIRESDPAPISTVSRVLRGDVETIVGKALEKDKGRRYDSASAFGEDIRRYLSDQPISARPPSAVYQIRKFAKRNKAVVAATVAGLVMLVAGTVVSTMFAIGEAEARRDAQRNEQRALEAQALAQERLEVSERALARARVEESKYKTIGELHDHLLSLANTDHTDGQELTIRDAFERAVGEYVENPEASAEARAFYRKSVGSTFSGLGYYREAAEHLERATELYSEALGPMHPETILSRSRYARALMNLRGPEAMEGMLEPSITAMRDAIAQGEDRRVDLADLLRVEGTARGTANDAERGGAALREAIAIYEEIGMGASGDVGDALNSLAGMTARAGDLDEALELYERAIGVYVGAWGERSMRTATVRTNSALLLDQMGRLDEAAEQFGMALETQRAMSGSRATPGLAHTSKLLGNLLRRLGRLEEAEAMLRESVAQHHELFDGRHVNEAYAMSDLASVLTTSDRFNEALELFERAREIIVREKGEDHISVGVLDATAAEAMMKGGRAEEAIAMHRRAIGVYRRTYPEAHFYITRGKSALAQALAHGKQFEEGERVIREVIDTLTRLGGESNQDLTYAYGTLAVVLCRSGDFERGAEALRQAIDVADRTGLGREANTAALLGERGGVLTHLGRYDEAERELLRQHELISAMSMPRSWTQANAIRLATLYEKMGREEEASAWRRAAGEDAGR